MPDDPLVLIVPNADGLLQSRPDNGARWQINWFNYSFRLPLHHRPRPNLLTVSALNYLQRNRRRTIGEHPRIDRREQRRLFDVSRGQRECDR